MEKKTREQLRKEIAEFKEQIANFNDTHGNPLGCSMRTLTLQSMYYHLDALIEQLHNS